MWLAGRSQASDDPIAAFRASSLGKGLLVQVFRMQAGGLHFEHSGFKVVLFKFQHTSRWADRVRAAWAVCDPSFGFVPHLALLLALKPGALH